MRPSFLSMILSILIIFFAIWAQTNLGWALAATLIYCVAMSQIYEIVAGQQNQ